MKKIITLLVASTFFMGCASTEETADGSVTAEKKKSCTSIKVMGSKLPKRVCKS